MARLARPFTVALLVSRIVSDFLVLVWLLVTSALPVWLAQVRRDTQRAKQDVAHLLWP